MFTSQRFTRKILARRLSTFALAALAMLVTTVSVSADPMCKKVSGHYDEHLVAPELCTTSPFGLCIEGEYFGDVRGTFSGAVTTLTPGSVPSVQIFTSDSTIHARLNDRAGDLLIKNAGAFNTTGNGEIVDLQFITGGTGQLSGASGVIRASGVFDFATGMGRSDYEGTICLP